MGKLQVLRAVGKLQVLRAVGKLQVLRAVGKLQVLRAAVKLQVLRAVGTLQVLRAVGKLQVLRAVGKVQVLRAAGKLQELTHEMDRYRLNTCGFWEMRLKNFGKTVTEEGRKVFFSEKKDKHEHGVGFIVHKDIIDTVMECPVSSRLITIHLRAVPFNITVVQVYTRISNNDVNKIEELYDQLQNVIDQFRRTFLLCKETGMQKCARVLMKTGKAFADCSAVMTQMRERELRLLEFGTFNDLVLANTSGHHKASKRWTWHSPNGHNHNQIDYSSEEALPIRSEQCQNTKFSRSRHWK